MATLGIAGRTVRCSRCKETWLARPEDASEIQASAPALAEAEPFGRSDTAAEWDDPDRQDDSQEADPPMVESPSISGDWPSEDEALQASAPDWPPMSRHGRPSAGSGRRPRLAWLRTLQIYPAARRGSGKRSVSLTTGCAAMGALALALIIWRVDVVRLLPQTAAFYKMVGLEVNLRGLAFKDVKISTETVEGKPVLVIEGVITDEARKPVELPRLRFSVRDAQGAEIYAWNAVLEQPTLKPGEKAWFKSRLASPPVEGRSIEVRFFSRRDIAGGSA